MIEPELLGLTRKVSNRTKPVDQLLKEVSGVFDQAQWAFSPTKLLETEKTRVEAAADALDVLKIMPGKPYVAVAAKFVGQQPDAYMDIVAKALKAKDGALVNLGKDLEKALEPHLPSRRAKS